MLWFRETGKAIFTSVPFRGCCLFYAGSFFFDRESRIYVPLRVSFCMLDIYVELFSTTLNLFPDPFYIFFFCCCLLVSERQKKTSIFKYSNTTSSLFKARYGKNKTHTRKQRNPLLVQSASLLSSLLLNCNLVQPPPDTPLVLFSSSSVLYFVVFYC